jgi:hypothetical protein
VAGNSESSGCIQVHVHIHIRTLPLKRESRPGRVEKWRTRDKTSNMFELLLSRGDKIGAK